MAREQYIYEVNAVGGKGFLIDRRTEQIVGTTSRGVDLYFVNGETNPLTGGFELSAGETAIPVTSPMTFAQLQFAIAAGFVGLAFVTDMGNGSIWVSDGTRARPLNGEVVLYSNLSPVPLSNAQARAVGIAVPLPIGLWQNGDVLEVSCDISKSGAVDGSNTYMAVGASAALTGTQLGNGNMNFSAANRRYMGTFRFLRNSATSVTLLNGPTGQDGLVASSDLASTTATVLDMDAALRYLQLSNAMGVGGSDVLSVTKMFVNLISA